MKRDKTEDYTKLTTTNIKKYKRVGDTVKTRGLYNYKFKDTTIYNTNRVTGTTQLVRYDNQGQIEYLECMSGYIDTLIHKNEQLVKLVKANTKEVSKEFKIKPVVILYFIIVLIVIVISCMLYVRFLLLGSPRV